MAIEPVSTSIAVVSLAISVWNKYSDNKSAKIDNTSNFVSKSLENISDEDFIFLTKNHREMIEETCDIQCIEKKLSPKESQEFKKKRLAHFDKHLPKRKQDLASDILQFYRSVKFFLQNGKIDEKTLSILLQSELETHFDILKDAIIDQKIFPSEKLNVQDLLKYLEDLIFVTKKILSTKIYTPVMESRIEQRKSKIEEFLRERK